MASAERPPSTVIKVFLRREQSEEAKQATSGKASEENKKEPSEEARAEKRAVRLPAAEVLISSEILVKPR